jgi:anti-sigma B factor antagonist
LTGSKRIAMNFTIEDKGRYTLVTSNVDKLDTTCAPELKSELVYLNKTNVRNVIIDSGRPPGIAIPPV